MNKDRFVITPIRNADEQSNLAEAVIREANEGGFEPVVFDISGRTFGQVVYEDIDPLVRCEREAKQTMREIVNPHWAKRPALVIVTGLSEARSPNRQEWLSFFHSLTELSSKNPGRVVVLDSPEFFESCYQTAA